MSKILVKFREEDGCINQKYEEEKKAREEAEEALDFVIRSTKELGEDYKKLLPLEEENKKLREELNFLRPQSLAARTYPRSLIKKLLKTVCFCKFFQDTSTVAYEVSYMEALQELRAKHPSLELDGLPSKEIVNVEYEYKVKALNDMYISKVTDEGHHFRLVDYWENQEYLPLLLKLRN